MLTTCSEPGTKVRATSRELWGSTFIAALLWRRWSTTDECNSWGASILYARKNGRKAERKKGFLT